MTDFYSSLRFFVIDVHISTSVVCLSLLMYGLVYYIINEVVATMVLWNKVSLASIYLSDV